MTENQQDHDMFEATLKRKDKSSIKNIFFTGIVAMTPLVITFYILRLVYDLIVKNLTPLFTRISHIYKVSLPEQLTGLATVALFVLLVLIIGLLTRMYIGKLALTLIDRTATSIPVVSPIYSSIKQIIESFRSSSENFQKVVLVEFPRKGICSVGFVVRKTQNSLENVVGVPCYNIYIPTTPNPTSGFITIIPQADCRDVDITVEQGIKFILSVGIINYDNPETAKQALEKNGNVQKENGN